MTKVHLRDRQIVVHNWIEIISFGKTLEKKKPENRIHPVLSLTEDRESSSRKVLNQIKLKGLSIEKKTRTKRSDHVHGRRERVANQAHFSCDNRNSHISNGNDPFTVWKSFRLLCCLSEPEIALPQQLLHYLTYRLSLTSCKPVALCHPLSVAFLANWRIFIWNRYLWVFCQHEDIFKQNFYIYHGSDGIEQIL